MNELAKIVTLMKGQHLETRVEAIVRFSQTWDRIVAAQSTPAVDTTKLMPGLSSPQDHLAYVRAKRSSRSTLRFEIPETALHDPRVFVFQVLIAAGARKMNSLLRGEHRLGMFELGFIYLAALGVAPAVLNNRDAHLQPPGLALRRWAHWTICPVSDEFAATTIAVWLLDKEDQLAELKPLVTRRMYRMVSAYLPQVRAALAASAPSSDARTIFQTPRTE
jgi:hypothetical protein